MEEKIYALVYEEGNILGGHIKTNADQVTLTHTLQSVLNLSPLDGPSYCDTIVRKLHFQGYSAQIVDITMIDNNGAIVTGI